MDERRVADYFVVAGLPDNLEPMDNLSDSGHLKVNYEQAPITDIGIIFPMLNEILPPEWVIVERTPTGHPANLNHGSLRSPECYVCYRRGTDKPPLIDIGIMYEGKEYLMNDAECVVETVGGHIANVNNSSTNTFVTFRRAKNTATYNALVVTDICVVNASKGEIAPHAFCRIEKNLNKGLTGSDVFLCYKKSTNRPKLLSYQPGVIYRYPTYNHADFAYPDSVPLFCLPMGATLELWPRDATAPLPVFSTFILTVSDELTMHKIYGSAVTFYEDYPYEKLSPEQAKQLDYHGSDAHSLHVNKSICLLSHWAFSDMFQKWLLFLHDFVQSKQKTPIPIERYIAQLLEEISFPSPRTLIQLSPYRTDLLMLTQPEELPLPRSAAGFRQLLLNLGAEHCMQVMLLALTEQKMLIHSLRPDTLTAVAEAVSTLLFPFKWQCPYIPLCPLGLAEVLHAPLPYLIGVDSRFFDLYEPPVDVSCVDLDTNNIQFSDSQKHLTTKVLPKRPARVLRNTLDKLYNNLKNMKTTSSRCEIGDNNVEKEFLKQKLDQAIELEIQEAFLRFMASILKGYRNYLLPITRAPTVGTTDPQALFELTAFLRSRDKTYHTFYKLLMRTQMFIRFIEESSFAADSDQCLAFFDDCNEKLTSDECEVKLLESDLGTSDSERTVFILPPEPPVKEQGSSPIMYSYETFTLDFSLMKSKRPSQLMAPINATPGSPMARRTKHEIKTAQRLAQISQKRPDDWARCLLGTCYSIYFMVLPSVLCVSSGNERTLLRQAYDLLGKAWRLGLVCDEVCYRLMMQLCGEQQMPLLAVKLLLLMKKSGVQPNAVTYGLYNRCVLEATWPTQASTSQLLWNKLRHVVVGAAHFRRAGIRYAAKRNAGDMKNLDASDRCLSHASLDSYDNTTNSSMALVEVMTSHIRKRIGSIVRIGNTNGGSGIANAVMSSAGFFMSTGLPTDSNKQSTDSLVDDGVLKQSDDNKPESRRASNDASNVRSVGECLSMLARSGSFASDANMLQKLQHLQRKSSCARNLGFNDSEESLFEDKLEDEDKNKVSPRTPVTENDPLGALENDVEQQTKPSRSQSIPNEKIVNVENNNQMNKQKLSDEQPILFRNSVQRSATFDAETDQTAAKTKSLTRSETLPPVTSPAGSFANIGSSFKLNLSRYSPARLSLRKTDFKSSPHQLFETAISNISPSFTAKRSNELLQGGLSSIKSAATNLLTKKLDEIKEAISATSTPVKLNPLANNNSSGSSSKASTLERFVGMNSSPCRHFNNQTTTCDECIDAVENSLAGRGAAADYGEISRNGSSNNLKDSDRNIVFKIPEELYPSSNVNDDEPIRDYALELCMSTCSQCHNCNGLLYDEEIMSNWFADDSNLNTRCSICSRLTVPLLTIYIIKNNNHTMSQYSNCDEERMPSVNDNDENKVENSETLTAPVSPSSTSAHCDTPSPSETKTTINNSESSVEETLSVPYLNPLVLRKELENILTQEGDLTVSDPRFIVDHPIIYWNLLWCFERIDVQTHLPNLYLKTGHKNNSSTTTLQSGDNDNNCVDTPLAKDTQRVLVETGFDPLTQDEDLLKFGLVRVQCQWDNPLFHNQLVPMYLNWQRRKINPRISAHLVGKSTFNQTVMQKIITSIRCNDLFEPLKRLVNERQKILNNGSTVVDDTTQSAYRDILFLALVALKRNGVNIFEFDTEYESAYNRLLELDNNLRRDQDKPPNLRATLCRHYFKPLALE